MFTQTKVNPVRKTTALAISLARVAIVLERLCRGAVELELERDLLFVTTTKFEP